MTEYAPRTIGLWQPPKNISWVPDKNVLYDDARHWPPCPRRFRPQNCQFAKDCGGAKCPMCTLRTLNGNLVKFKLCVAAQYSIAACPDADTPAQNVLCPSSTAPCRYLCVTLKLNTHCLYRLGPDSRDWYNTSLKLMESATEVIKSVRQPHVRDRWPGTSLQYVRVLHFKPVDHVASVEPMTSYPAYVAHAHFLVRELANAEGGFVEDARWESYLAAAWDRKINCNLSSFPETQQDFPAPVNAYHPGHRYCKPCENSVDALAYMFWEHGRPWHWGNGGIPYEVRCQSASQDTVRRVTSSPNFYA